MKSKLILLFWFFPFLIKTLTSKNIEEKTSTKNEDPFLLGIDNFDDYKHIFQNKRVGLITNPTGIRSDFEASIDFLFRTTNLTALFAPEHGIRGNAQAGGEIDEEIDVKTGLTVYSLYGKTIIPTEEMLKNVDILTIDIQDVGARFYTYIYTMAYAMQACQKYNKSFVVFDRPNPVGGNILDGNILEIEQASSVGLYPIIVRHGMTIGELALLFNSKFEIGCDLKIVKMKGYDRNKFYDELNIPWVNPSPNMPTIDTALVYTGTCLFEGVNVSEGRGTTKPFEFIGAPFIDPFQWSDKLNSLKLPGVYFRPVYFTPTFSDYVNEQCAGVQVHITNRNIFQSYKTGIAMVYTIKEMYPDKVQFLPMLKKLTGTSLVYDMSVSMEEMFDIIDKDRITFYGMRQKYLLYP